MKNCIPSNVDKRSKLYRDLEQYQEYLYRKNLSDNTVRSLSLIHISEPTRH